MEQVLARQYVGIDYGKESVQLSIYDEGTAEMTEESFALDTSEEDTFRAGFQKIEDYLRAHAVGWDRFTKVCFTMDDASEGNRQKLSTAVSPEFKEIHEVRIMTRFRAFVEYVFHQEKVVWDHNTILFDFDGKKLSYVMVDQIRRAKQRAYRAVIHDIDLAGTGIEAGDPELDQKFGQTIRQFMMKHQAQIVFLTGQGFEGNWMKRTLTYLCAGRRVFLGQNIYANGVCLSGISHIPMMDEGMLLMEGPDMVYHTLGIVISDYGRARYIPITSIGREWYNSKGSLDIILDKSQKVDFFYHNTKENEIEGATCELKGLPKRPNKTTRIHIEVCFSSATEGVILLKDMGFGTMFKATGKVTMFPFTLVS